MTATDELRRMLDERGVGHYDTVGITEWDVDGIHYLASDHLRLEGRMVLRRTCTPEQAIEATLGRGTCHNTWDVEQTGRLRFQCSECKAVSLEITPCYCPNCGRRVVDE